MLNSVVYQPFGLTGIPGIAAIEIPKGHYGIAAGPTNTRIEVMYAQLNKCAVLGLAADVPGKPDAKTTLARIDRNAHVPRTITGMLRFFGAKPANFRAMIAAKRSSMELLDEVRTEMTKLGIPFTIERQAEIFAMELRRGAAVDPTILPDMVRFEPSKTKTEEIQAFFASKPVGHSLKQAFDLQKGVPHGYTSIKPTAPSPSWIRRLGADSKMGAGTA